MNKSFSISFILLFYCSLLVAQTNLNAYKYILVPKQFEFQNSVDQYQLNSLTKFLFKKSGYTVLFTDEQYPEDLANKSCLALKVKVNKYSSLFKTKLTIDLLDCQNNIVYTSKEGASKEKDYKKGFQEALRKAYAEFEELNYAYDENSTQKSILKETSVKAEVVAKTNIVKVPKAPKAEKVVALKETVKEPVLAVEKTDVVVKEVKTEFKKEVKVNKVIPIKKSIVKTIEGIFNFDNWGHSTISKDGENYVVIGGDENFEFATIYKTSKRTIFIIKWVAYKQPQLVELNSDGNLKIDSKNGVKTYNRVD